MPATRNYSNTAPPITLAAAVSSAATVLPVASTAGYPAPFFVVAIERGTANEELCLCTAMGATTLTVERGYDGTAAVAHGIGVAVEHTVSAADYRTADLHVNDPGGASHSTLANHAGSVTGVVGGIGHTGLVQVQWYVAKGDLLVANNPGSIARIVAGTPGHVLTMGGDGLPGWGVLPNQQKVYRSSHTWGITGDIRVPSGSIDYIPPMLFGRHPNEISATLVGWRALLQGAGATPSVTFTVLHNMGAFAGNSVATTVPVTVMGLGQPVTDGETFGPVISAISGTPKNLSVTVYVDHVLG